jgi:hypothetical protein
VDLDKVPLTYSRPLPRFIEDILLPSDHFYHLPKDSSDKQRNYWFDRECEWALHKNDAA